MRHMRQDYQGRIVDLTGGIGEDEPVFLVRGQDVMCPSLIEAWARGVHNRGGDPEVVQAAMQYADEVRGWQQTNGSKVPDVPREALPV